MQLSFIGIIIIAEVMLVLLAGVGFLLIRNRKKAALIVKLKERISALSKGGSKTASALPAQAKDNTTAYYSNHLDEQLALTKQYHQNLSPDQDISLDLGLSNPLPRQIVALRHALLTSEKQAIIGSDSKKPNWMILQDKLSSIIDFYTQQKKPVSNDENSEDPDSTETEQLKQRISNLEKFKKLYFDLEKKWEEAQKQAGECYNDLAGYAESNNDETLTSLVDRYQNSYNDFDKLVSDNSTTKKASVIEIVRTDPKTNAEVKHLRSIAIDQQRKINELQNKLKADSTDPELAKELQQQLEQQNQFIKESESCITLLESELQRAFNDLDSLQEALKDAKQPQKAHNEDNTDKEAALNHYAKDNQRLQIVVDELEKTIIALQEDSNAQQDSLNNNAPENDPKLKEALTDLQQQYNELEEKYLELKMR